MPYPSRLLALHTAPASEPIALSDAKNFLRVEHSADDALITLLIAAARGAAEEFTRRSFITQSWKLAFDEELPEVVDLPRGPVQSVISVTSVARDGTPTVIGSGLYILNAAKDALLIDTSVMGTRVEVVYVTGYGNAASDVPPALRQGILHHLAALYDARESSEAVVIPAASLALYAPYREVRI